MLTLNDGRSELWQWDTGRTLAVDADCSQVHFGNKVFGRSIDVDVIDGSAIIPDVLLQTDKDLNVWAFVGTAENGYTKISKTFKVNRRNKPADYVFTPPDQTSIEEIKEKIDYLESKLETEIPSVDDTLTQPGQAADAAEVGARLSSLSEENVKSAELDEDNMVSFKNSAGLVLFTLDLSGLGTPASYGNLVLSAESLTIEEGGTGVFTVALDSAPSANQIVYLAVSDNTRLTISPATLTFTPVNWSTPQTVTVTALQDEDEEDNSVTVTLTSRKVDPKQFVVSIGDDDKPIITQDGLALYFNYRGHTDDTSTTITDEVHGVTASNFDAFLTHDNCIYGQAPYRYFTLTLTDEPGLAFKEMMKNSDGFTVESFGTLWAPSFFMPNYRTLVSCGNAWGNGIGANGSPKANLSNAPTRILSDGTSDYSNVSIIPVFTINGTEYRPGSNAASWKNMP